MVSKPHWNQVTVVGCGLIGSSFARALKKHMLCDRVFGWDTAPANLNEAMALDVIDEVDPAFVAGGVSDSDLLYLAMPVLSIIEFLSEHIPKIKPGAIITDAGSTKLAICETAAKHLPGNRHFVGGHPIAGSHLSGVRNGHADLMAGVYVMIYDQSVDSNAFDDVKQTIEAIGARPKSMTAAQHDRVFAIVSHLPQLLSSALASTVSDQQDANSLLELAGAGYQDMTRLAGSSWSMWSDVLATNRAEICSVLDQLIDKLTLIRDELHHGNLLSDSIVSSLFKQQP